MTLLHDGRRVDVVCLRGRTVDVCAQGRVVVPAHRLTVQPSTRGYGVTDLFDRGRHVATQILSYPLMLSNGVYDTYPIPQNESAGTRTFLDGGGMQLDAVYSIYGLKCGQASKWSSASAWAGVDKVTVFCVFELLTEIDPTIAHPVITAGWNNGGNKVQQTVEEIDLSKPGYYTAVREFDVVHNTSNMMLSFSTRFANDKSKRPSVWRIWAQGVIPSDEYAAMRACGVECFGPQGIRRIGGVPMFLSTL
ncbi:hypothetical protein [Bifidobacterium samirii]|uniref:Uncharacterized protein n=1 Tax=Bifidobacterium samirii TaxID=2306974 RepID=A0A430FUM0_9BIFI|nr:hypothetical protein [Bifidobacterium samirii]RSX56784.1 hypothetical protein D2E24_1074 [Bifidobacterium samirii]